jgi:hypothetical protein
MQQSATPQLVLPVFLLRRVETINDQRPAQGQAGRHVGFGSPQIVEPRGNGGFQQDAHLKGKAFFFWQRPPKGETRRAGGSLYPHRAQKISTEFNINLVG